MNKISLMAIAICFSSISQAATFNCQNSDGEQMQIRKHTNFNKLVIQDGASSYVCTRNIQESKSAQNGYFYDASGNKFGKFTTSDGQERVLQTCTPHSLYPCAWD